MSNVTSESILTTKEIVEQAIQDYHMSILPYLAKSNNGYSETPIGAMQMFDDDTAPSGWLVADGTVYNIEDYPFLANHFERVHGSKNYYGGNGTTTFAVPDWQGEFFRASGTNSHPNQGNGAAVGEHQDATEHKDITANDFSVGLLFTRDPYTNPYAKESDSHYNPSTVGYAGRIANISNTAEIYGIYTSRPTNTSLLCCIKAVPAGINYSLEEQEIGTWIDGKPLYQKCIPCINVTLSPNDWTIITSSNVLTNCIIIGGYVTRNEHRGVVCAALGINNSNNAIKVNSNVMYSFTTNDYVIAQYIKTTD